MAAPAALRASPPSTRRGPRPGRANYDPVTSRSRRILGARSIGALLAIRFLLVGNGVALAAFGALYILYAARPGGLVVGGILLSLSALLFGCVPFTDPYRQRSRRSARRGAP